MKCSAQCLAHKSHKRTRFVTLGQGAVCLLDRDGKIKPWSLFSWQWLKREGKERITPWTWSKSPFNSSSLYPFCFHPINFTQQLPPLRITPLPYFPPAPHGHLPCPSRTYVGALGCWQNQGWEPWFLNFGFIYLFIYLWLCWVFVSVRGLSLVVASGGCSSSRCVGLSLSRPLLLQSTGSRRAGSVVVACGLSRSAACGIFPDQGSNPCPLH